MSAADLIAIAAGLVFLAGLFRAIRRQDHRPAVRPDIAALVAWIDSNFGDTNFQG
jgi:hypothetical protein